MHFPEKDLTNQQISTSYQDILQQYTSGSNIYVLDGYGFPVFQLPITSIENTIITSDITSSMSVSSAATSVTASYVIYSSKTVNVTLNTTTSLLQISNTTYNSVFVNYLVSDGTNFRAGNLVALYTTSSISWNEMTTNDIGDTNGIKLLTEIDGPMVKISAINNTPTNFTIKYHYELL